MGTHSGSTALVSIADQERMRADGKTGERCKARLLVSDMLEKAHPVRELLTKKCFDEAR